MSVLNTLLGGLDVTTVFIFLVVFFIGFYWLTTPKNLPPGPPGLPLVGSLLPMLRSHGDFLALMKKWHEEYGSVISVKIGSKNLIVTNSYEMMLSAFVKQSDVFSGRPTQMHILNKIDEATGVGVIISEGSLWKELRRLTLMSLRDMGLGKKSLEQRVHEEARALVEVLEKGQGQPLSVAPLMPKFSANIICNFMLGDRFDYEDPTFVKLTADVKEFVSAPSLFTPVNLFPFLRFVPSHAKEVDTMVSISKRIDAFLGTVLKDHEETYDPMEVRDFVDLYIKTREETKEPRTYDASNMRRVILDLLAAGTDTTATSLYWFVLLLITHPDKQKRCQQDVDEAIGHGRMATMEDRKKLPYIMAFITETMRLFPVVPLALPHKTVTEGKMGEFTVPPNSIVLANVFEIHRDPTAWPDPLAFKPERFLGKDGQFCAPKANFVPFSIGPRMCLGESLANMEMFILCVTLVQTFTFTMPQGQKPDLQGHLGATYTAKPQEVLANRR